MDELEFGVDELGFSIKLLLLRFGMDELVC